MKSFLLCAALITFSATTAASETNVLISMYLKDEFQDSLLEGAKQQLSQAGVGVRVVNSAGDQAAQIAAIELAVKEKISAIVLAAPNDIVAAKADEIAAAAGIPLVYMNVLPGLEQFRSTASIVASNDLVAGRLQMHYLAKLIDNAGNIGILTGEAKHPAAIGRRAGIQEVLNTLPKVTVVAEAAADWSRDRARQIVATWLREGKTFKAIVAGNDEMALGAAEALKAAGVRPGTVAVAGTDATRPARNAMIFGEMAFTVRQNGKAQGARSGENILAMLNGKPVPLYDWVPYELVLPSNLAEYN